MLHLLLQEFPQLWDADVPTEDAVVQAMQQQRALFHQRLMQLIEIFQPDGAPRDEGQNAEAAAMDLEPRSAQQTALPLRFVLGQVVALGGEIMEKLPVQPSPIREQSPTMLGDPMEVDQGKLGDERDGVSDKAEMEYDPNDGLVDRRLVELQSTTRKVFQLSEQPRADAVAWQHQELIAKEDLPEFFEGEKGASHT